MDREGSGAGVPSRRDEGFSLVEVIAATVIFVAISTSAMVLLVQALQIVRSNADRVAAAGIARGIVEDLQAQGAEYLTPGLTTETVTQGGVDYTASIDAAWVAVDQQADPCTTTVDPTGLAFMRVTVAVTGGRLSGPQVIDALVPRRTEAVASDTGSVSVRVLDNAGVGVSGVEVALTDAATGLSLPRYLTGFDGCLLIPQVPVGTGWSVTISKSGYVTPGPGQDTLGVQVASGVNSPVSFVYAESGRMRFRSIDDSYPLIADDTLSLTLDPWNLLPDPPYEFPFVIDGLFPGSYQAWPGTCSDAGSRQATVVVAPGGTSVARLEGNLIQIVAPPGTEVTLEHQPLDAQTTCPDDIVPSYTLGIVDDSAILRANVPTGAWVLKGVVSDDTVLDDTTVNLSGLTLSPCSTGWDLGLIAEVDTAGSELVTLADQLADDSNAGVVTQNYLVKAAREIPVEFKRGPADDEITIAVILGAVRAQLVIGITAADRAEIRGEASLLIGDPPIPFVTAPSCSEVAP